MPTDYPPYHPPGSPDFDSITAGNAALMRQAQATACDYMRSAQSDVDELFGDGYAKAHPELVAAYMQTAAADLGFAVVARAVESLEGPITSVASAVEDSALKVELYSVAKEIESFTESFCASLKELSITIESAAENIGGKK